MQFDTPLSFVHNLGADKSATIRQAMLDDALRIQDLYFLVYRGQYPLSIVNNLDELHHALTSDDILWLVAEVDGQIIGSVIYKISREQRIAKSFGAIVNDKYRGHNITQITMKHVQDVLFGKDKVCDLIYATTRTESAVPQKLTERLGYKKLGIFPNVRKIVDYETHCLAALFDSRAFATRHKPPILLPELKSLYEITRTELRLEHAKIEDYTVEDDDPAPRRKLLELETIEAPNFVKRRFEQGIRDKRLTMQFFPFHDPNLMLCNDNQDVEIYMFHAPQDHHSCLIGGFWGDHSYETVLESLCAKAKAMGIRYIELLLDAYHPKRLREAINARFLPSAYFPAFRLVQEDEPAAGFKNGERLDYVVFSRSFEMLDFKNIQLEGIYKRYLKYYFNMWCGLFIEGSFEE